MKIRIVFTVIGSILVLLWATYLGWRFAIIPVLAWELFGREGMVTWDLIALILAYGLVLLVPGAVLLYFGIRGITKYTKRVRA